MVPFRVPERQAVLDEVRSGRPRPCSSFRFHMSAAIRRPDTIYDRALHVVRNPLDSVVSRLNLRAVDKARALNATAPEFRGNKHELKPIRTAIDVNFRALTRA